MTPTSAIRLAYFGTISAVFAYTAVSGVNHMLQRRFDRKVAQIAAPELEATAYAKQVIKEMIDAGVYTQTDPNRMLKDFEDLRKLHLAKSITAS